MRVSVAMAAYNGEKFIKEQVQSILDNLTEGDELVVSDDGSTDATKEILLSFKELLVTNSIKYHGTIMGLTFPV